MAARRSKPAKTGAELREHFFKQSNRVYLAWLVGIVIGALGLKPTSVNAAGLSLSIERPDIIQGLVFLICMWETYVSLFLLFGTNAFKGRDRIRNLLWSELPKRPEEFQGSNLG